MPFRIFTIPISHSTAAEAELNAFLRNHKILQIERRWIDQGPNSCWTFCVDYADPTAAANGATPGRGGSVKARTDYREILSPVGWHALRLCEGRGREPEKGTGTIIDVEGGGR